MAGPEGRGEGASTGHGAGARRTGAGGGRPYGAGPPTQISEAPGYLRLAETVRSRFRELCATASDTVRRASCPGWSSAIRAPGRRRSTSSSAEPGSPICWRCRERTSHSSSVWRCCSPGDRRVRAIDRRRRPPRYRRIRRVGPTVAERDSSGRNGRDRSARDGGVATASGDAGLGCCRRRGAAGVARLAVDVGFAMSVAATAALIAVSPRLRDRLVDRGMPRGIADAVAMATVAYLVTARWSPRSRPDQRDCGHREPARCPGRPGGDAVERQRCCWPHPVCRSCRRPRRLGAACAPALVGILTVARWLGGPWATIPAAPASLLGIGVLCSSWARYGTDGPVRIWHD